MLSWATQSVLSERHKFLGERKRAMVLGRCVTMAIVRVVLDGKTQKNFLGCEGGGRGQSLGEHPVLGLLYGVSVSSEFRDCSFFAILSIGALLRSRLLGFLDVDFLVNCIRSVGPVDLVIHSSLHSVIFP